MIVIRHLFDPVADVLAAVFGTRVHSLVIERWFAGRAFVHEVGKDGVTSEMRDEHGAVLPDRADTVLLNRVSSVPVPAFQSSSAADREYAGAEATAAFWSWLEGMPGPVWNTVGAVRLSCQGRPVLEAMAHAAGAGLRTQALRMTTRCRLADAALAGRSAGAAGPAPSVGAPAVIVEPADGQQAVLWVVGDRIVGAVEGVASSAVLEFARRTGLGFGTVTFVRAPGGAWLWSGFDALPAEVPPPVLSALAQHLDRMAASFPGEGRP